MTKKNVTAEQLEWYFLDIEANNPEIYTAKELIKKARKTFANVGVQSFQDYELQLMINEAKIKIAFP